MREISEAVYRDHYEKYEKLAQQIGVDHLKPLIPFSRAAIIAALKENEHLNNLPLNYKFTGIDKKGWDACHEYVIRFRPCRLLSISETVCLLKHVAIYHVAGATYGVPYTG
jgi:hypothetical protein